jgi:hypothetical protein
MNLMMRAKPRLGPQHRRARYAFPQKQRQNLAAQEIAPGPSVFIQMDGDFLCQAG